MGGATSATDSEFLTRFVQARADPALVVLEGFHALKHALRFGAAVELVAATDPGELEQLAAELAPDLAGRFAALARPVAPDVLGALTSRPHHTGVAAIARKPAFALDGVARDARIVLLEDPRRLGNVGAVVRVAAAADAGAVLTTGAVDPWDPAALRGSAGLHFALPVGRWDRELSCFGVAGRHQSRTVPATTARGDEHLASRPLLALDPDGDALDPAAVPPGAVLAFGTERDGLSEALLARADARVALPMRAGVSSLNLATAVAAVLFVLGAAGPARTQIGEITYPHGASVRGS